jgi:hypothetical protein
MTHREVSKKWRAVREAWEDGAEVEARNTNILFRDSSRSEWHRIESPRWDGPDNEFRIKRQEPLVHFHPDPPFCSNIRKGSDRWTFDHDAVTCPECRERARIHYLAASVRAGVAFGTGIHTGGPRLE